MVESQIDLVSRHLPDTTLLFVNDAYCKFYGFKREELIGQSFLITEAPEVREALLAKIWDEMHTPGPHISENLTLHPDGRERWIQWMSYAFADEDGKVTMIQAVGREITEQKLAERVLRENEQRFRAMLEGASEGIALIDGHYRLVQINRYIEERFAYSREQLVDQPCGILIEEASRPSILAALQEARRSGESINMRLTPPPMARSSTGEAFPIEITFVPLTVSGEQMTMCLLVDITERQQLEEQRLINRALEVELEKERELIDLKQRFTTMVTHEFRTPLAIIQSTVNIVQNYFDRLPQDKLAERLDVVTKQAKRMSELLTDVLMYSRGERGLRPATLELIDLALFTRAIIDDLRTADNDAHPVTLSVNNPPVKLETDRRLLEHICLNLIGNAIKYSPPGSLVDVSVSREGTEIILKVRDRGIGIPAGDLPRIYDPFHRAANVGSRSGSGLGLPIVKQCVDALGGTINVESNVGQGSTFTVRLTETAASG
jgi:PAS domain S-box-containing protein